MTAAGPAGPTPDGVLAAIKTALPDRVGSGIWVNVLNGGLDQGATITLYQKDRVSALGLAGHKTFGAALGYEFAQKDNVSASVFGGAAHPYSGVLTKGWAPVAGLSIKF